MNKIVDNLIRLGSKYNFKIIKDNDRVDIVAKTTNNEDIRWITYNIENDTVSHLGNTDQCCIWFCDTRKDLTPEKCVQFIEDLNTSLELVDGERFLMQELIDPEDWQAIAGIYDAYKDERYIK